MIQAIKEGEIDVGIGLTEAWVAGLGKEKDKAGYKLVGTFVETPLCWAVSAGSNSQFEDVRQLKGKKFGVSRIGSGSYVMAYVLARQFGWLKKSDQNPPFNVVVLDDFAKLRQGVNDGSADVFLWEHFTSKKFFDNGELKRIGEIYSPWSSWKIVARDPTDGRLRPMFESINQGIGHFNNHRDAAIEYICTNMEYSLDDAREWIDGVRFSRDVSGVDPEVVDQTTEALERAGVLQAQEYGSKEMIAIRRASRASS